MNIQSLTLSAVIAAAPFGCATPPVAAPTSAPVEPARAAPVSAAPAAVSSADAATLDEDRIAPACALKTIESAGGVVLVAEVANPRPGVRPWRLTLSSSGTGGTSRIAQSGEVSGPISGRDVVAEIRLGGAVAWEAVLTVEGAPRAGRCTANGRTPI